MSVVLTAARFRPPDAGEPVGLEREILTRIARGGLLICESELRYQLDRRGVETPRAVSVLAELEQRGLIESETHYRLTSAGAAALPVRERPAPGAVSSIPWGRPFDPPRPAPPFPPARRAVRAGATLEGL